MESYSIGQVIYILSHKSLTVLPGVVCEEIHHKTLEGEKVTYKVTMGPQNKPRIVDTASIDGEVYMSLEAVEQAMVIQFTSFVRDLCDQARQRAEAWYGTSGPEQYESSDSTTPKRLVDPSDLMQSFLQDEADLATQRALTTQEVVMEDGTVRQIPA